ncbi:class I SAM-dependent methyltransferase [Aggregatilineales bacterium SYSU G02658]
MTPEVIAHLNALNRQFYATVADAFDQTRGSAWPGWQRLLPHLPSARPLRVLDVGCGNGRFARFLHAAGVTIDYVGVDSSPALLAHARAALAALERWRLVEQDVIDQPIREGEYDLVVAFGVLHHVPARAGRVAFMRGLAQRVAPQGVLAYASWRFMEDARLRARIVPWPLELADAVEAGDVLLDWRQGAHALRYCHALDDAEQAELDASLSLTLLERYRADGSSGQLNAYSVLRHDPA